MVTLPFYRFHLQSALAAAASHQININITIQELFFVQTNLELSKDCQDYQV